MNLHAVAALFTTPDEATQVFDELKAAGFTRVEVSAVPENVPATASAAGVYDVAREDTAPRGSAGAPFFRKHDSAASSFTDELTLLGFARDDAAKFSAGVVAGGSLVTVDAAADPNRAREILSRFDADVREAAVIPEDDAAEAASETEATLQLRAERLQVDKHVVQHGQATVRKEIVTEMRTIEVPVSREELVIERQPVAPETGSGAPVGDTQEIRIPLSEERISVEKHAVVLEEVEIGTRRVHETQHVAETVRHEELRTDLPDERP